MYTYLLKVFNVSVDYWMFNFFKQSESAKKCSIASYEILPSSVQSLSCVWLFATPWTTACQASLSITNSQVFYSNSCPSSPWCHPTISSCRPLLLLPSIFPSIRVFSNESVLHIRWPKYWSFGFNISPSNEYSGLISFRMDWLELLAVQATVKVFSNSTV